MAFHSPELQLKVNDLARVLSKTWKARQKWYNIGLELGIQPDDLDCIGQNNSDPDSCFREMLKVWLRCGDEKTWQKLIVALKSETVRYDDVANSIVPSEDGTSTGPIQSDDVLPSGLTDVPKLNDYQAADDSNDDTGVQGRDNIKSIDLDPATVPTKAKEGSVVPVGFRCPCGMCSIDEFFGNKCPKSSSPVSKSFPYLHVENLPEKERNELYFTLMEETRGMICEFSDMIICMIKSFKERNIDPQDIKSSVISILSPTTSTILKKTKTINEIIDALKENGYLSFFNYHIAEQLIKQHGTQGDSATLQNQGTDQEALKCYETKFHQFCKRSIFEVPQDVFRPIPSDGKRLAFKVTSLLTKSIHPITEAAEDSLKNVTLSSTLKSSNTLKLSVEDTILTQGKIAKSLGLKSKWSLVFLGASEGCVQLNFSISIFDFNNIKSQLNVSAIPSPNSGIANLEESGIHILCGPPGLPYATCITDDSFTLNWARPEYTGSRPPEYYCICYQSTTDHPDKWRMENTEGPSEHLVIRNLSQKGSAFICKVQAINKIGTGIESKESKLITLSDTNAAELSQTSNIENKVKEKGSIPNDPNARLKNMFKTEIIDHYIIAQRHKEDWKKEAQERPLHVMVCGLGGVGKSTLINRLLQLEGDEKWAEEGRSGGATTSTVRTTKRGNKVRLFGIPGFDDVDMSNEMIIAMMEKETEKKLDIIFYCISLEGHGQVQQDDVRAIKIITQAFSNEIWKKAVVVFTFANALEEKNSADAYWIVIQRVKKKMTEVLRKEYVPEDNIKEIPMLTAGYTEPILRYEARECESMDGWDNRLFLTALKQVNPAYFPALFEVRWSWKDLTEARDSGAVCMTAAGSGFGEFGELVLGPAGLLVGIMLGSLFGAAVGIRHAGLGGLEYQLLMISDLKYRQWQLHRKPEHPYQANSKTD